MKGHAVLSALGRDRVGVADELITTLVARGVEIEHSRMTALGGRSAIIVQVCGPEDDIARLERDLALIGANLRLHLQLDRAAAPRPVSEATRLSLEAFSRGPSGFNAVTAVLKKSHVNIEHLETEAYAASWTSAITFHMKAHLTVPASISVTRLREELRELEHERRLDIQIEPVLPAVGEPAIPAR